MTVVPSSVLAPGLVNSFEQQAMTILQQNCISCHTASSGPGGVYDLANIDGLISNALLVSGNPSQSPIYLAVANGTMPPTGPLSQADQVILQKWILAGGIVVTATPTPLPTPVVSGTPTPSPSPTQALVTFTTLSNEILQPSCVSCHSTSNREGGYAFDTYANVIEFVYLSNLGASPLYTSTKSGAMPLNATALNGQQMELLEAWLQQGALNN